ncbi:DNA ligase 1-like [Eriocheir sinensis]|uniref:DNA ligase 1-like n=1 Tax=Eriocheir sinensis TaxID=95602 RepID=UPI0021C5C468|nr:DNA ligase 1-like [Eriocheir sinensis]XP_050696213.1 DNA ligase 1-like [Eriocheir sinensis]XP_050696214.1 DNA ligase 1-like [Eriocheir sinensis]
MTQRERDTLLEKYNLSVEQLDYTFVSECRDEKVLGRILRVLRSGEEGIYPHFIEYVEEQLAKVNPENRLLLRPQSALRVQDLSRSELASIEADLSEWAADLKKEKEEKRSGGGKEEEKKNEEEREKEEIDSDDDEIEEEEEEKEEEEDEEEKGRERTPSPPLLIPSDLPSLDNIEMSERSTNMTKRGQRSRQPLSKVRTDKKSHSSLIKDITVDHKVKLPVSYPLNKVMSARRSPGSFIEFVEDNEGQGSVRRSPGSLIEVLEDHEGQESCNRLTGVNFKVTEGQGSLSRSAGSKVKVTEGQGLVSRSKEVDIKVTGQKSVDRSAGADFKVTVGQGPSSRSADSDFKVTGQGSVSRSVEAEVKVMTGKEGQESAVITYRSSGSVIKVGQQAEGASSRQVAALLREAERQQAEGDLLSASLSYNKVLSLCPQQVEARRALSHLLTREESPAEPPAGPPPPSAGSVPLVQEVE